MFAQSQYVPGQSPNPSNAANASNASNVSNPSNVSNASNHSKHSNYFPGKNEGEMVEGRGCCCGVWVG